MMKTVKKLIALAISAAALAASAMSPSSVQAESENEAYYISYSVSFIDRATDKTIENINARIIKREYDADSEQYFVGDEMIVAEWNSSDYPIFRTKSFLNDTDRFKYRVCVDRLPDGYVFYGEREVDQGLLSGYVSEGNHHQNIYIDRGEPMIPDDFPLKGTYSVNLKAVERDTDISVKGIECELYRSDTGETVARWNTSETEVMHVDGLEYEFASIRKDNREGKTEYYVRALELPDDYELYPKNSTALNEWYVAGYWPAEFLEGNELNVSLRLMNTKKDYDTEFSEHILTTSSPTHQWDVTDPSSTTTLASTTVTAVDSKLEGDANLDGKTTIADAVAILQHIANRDKYELRPSALVNADVDGEAGVTANDARVLQEWDAGLR